MDLHVPGVDRGPARPFGAAFEEFPLPPDALGRDAGLTWAYLQPPPSLHAPSLKKTAQTLAAFAYSAPGGGVSFWPFFPASFSSSRHDYFLGWRPEEVVSLLQLLTA